jgi:ketosteroid isomerase-like protein
MSEQDNVQLVRQGYEAFGRGDLDGLLGLFDDQIQWTTPGLPDNPVAGQRRGVAAVREFFQTLDETMEMQLFEPREFIAQGDRVVVLGVDRSRLKATGTLHEYEWVHVFRVRNGKVVSFHEYGDTAPVAIAMRSAQATTA